LQGSPMVNEVKESVMKQVNTIQFDNKDDGDLMRLINNYTAIFNEKVMKKTPPRNVIRNFLTEELPKAIKRLTGNNGGQLTAN
jgi:hypothetical protein